MAHLLIVCEEVFLMDHHDVVVILLLPLLATRARLLRAGELEPLLLEPKLFELLQPLEPANLGRRSYL